ncbi:hypothetical protein LLE86_10280 [Staphylococcus epidermidis]|nr:hypothetical protein [Staphylococcus epidermidis]
MNDVNIGSYILLDDGLFNFKSKNLKKKNLSNYLYFKI